MLAAGSRNVLTVSPGSRSSWKGPTGSDPEYPGYVVEVEVLVGTRGVGRVAA